MRILVEVAREIIQADGACGLEGHRVFEVVRLVEEARPDVIHHLAAQSSVTYSLAEPELDARAFERGTGWRPRCTLEEGIAAFAESLEN